MTNIVIILYFLIIIGIGFYSRTQIKSPVDFYIAGKKGGLFQISGSLLATILGGSAILGTLELSQKNGWAAVWFLLCASAGLFILAPISKYVSRYGKFTLPELLGLFFGKKVQLISSAIIPIAWLGIIAAQIIGAAKILNSIGFFGYTQAAIISGIIFILYTLVGGQKSVLKTDLFQAILILTGIIYLFLVLSTDHINITAGVVKPSGLFSDKFSVLDLIILFLTYSTTFIVGPDIYSRIFCAKSEKTALWSVIIVGAILIPFAVILTYIGLSSPPPEAGSQAISIISLGYIHLHPLAFGLLIASLLSAVMSSADTTLLTAAIISTELFCGSLEDKKTYRPTQISIIIIGILSLIISLFVTSIIQSLLLALSFFSGAFIIPTLAGLLKLKINKPMVIPALVSGGLIALTGKLISLYFSELLGNLIIIFSFICNGLILFFPFHLKKSPTKT
jgi:solute:Na+ symporter, SSS family